MKLLREYISELLESREFEWTPEMKAKWKESLDTDRRNYEHIHGTGRMNPDVVYDQLNQPVQANMYDGETYLDMIFDAIDHENWSAAANFILEALLIDDTGIDALDDLEGILPSVREEDDLAGAVAEWVPRYWKVNDMGRIMGRK
tara:strand:- start:119 stop:553 length:435 start_codon:yes stop_codon:yes gene_type:complete